MDVTGYRVLSLMIPQRISHRYRSDGDNSNYESEGVITSSRDTNSDNDIHNKINKIYALAVPNASHRVVLLEMRVGINSSGEVAVREIAQLEGLGYDDEFTERLCEHEENGGGGGGGGGYVLVAALVGANRRAIYRVPLEVPLRAGAGADGSVSAAGGQAHPTGRDWSRTVMCKY